MAWLKDVTGTGLALSALLVAVLFNPVIWIAVWILSSL